MATSSTPAKKTTEPTPVSKPEETTTPQVEAPKDEGSETNAGTDAPEAYATSDTALAEKAGISEGEVKALRDEAGLNQLAGHDADIHAWSLTPAGKKFADEESDRNKAEKAKAKAYDAQFNDDGVNPAEAKYVEAVEGK